MAAALLPLGFVLLWAWAACGGLSGLPEKPGSAAPAAAAGLPQATVTFLDVGQGAGVLFQAGDTALLFDGGARDAPMTGLLRQYGVRRLDLVVVTHGHADHVGGLPAVLRRFPVREVWYNGQVLSTPVFEDFVEAVQASGARYREPVRGYQTDVGPFHLQVLWPPQSAAQSQAAAHANMLVVRVAAGALTVLITGDLEKPEEDRLAAGAAGAAGVPVAAAVLQVGHHGSSTSSSLEFLRAVQPKVAIYQAQTGNPYGHPHREVVAAFQALGIPLFGTDRNGALRLVPMAATGAPKGPAGRYQLMDSRGRVLLRLVL